LSRRGEELADFEQGFAIINGGFIGFRVQRGVGGDSVDPC
jgi:hypothetical protein